MRKYVFRWILALPLLAAPVWAGIGDPVPANPCAGAAKFHDKLAVLDMNGGGCTFSGMETAITCTVKRGNPTANPADIAVEIYDQYTGASITGGPVCMAAALPAGDSITMLSGAIPPPTQFVGPIIPAPGGFCGANCYGRASARVFSTGRIECTATRIDLSDFCFAAGAPPAPNAVKNLTILNPANAQHGD